MSFYIIENEHGNTMDYNGYFNCQISQTELFDEPNEPAKLAEELGGHVVELVEAPAKIVVSEEEAKMLETAKHNPTLRPSFMITEYSNSHKGYILGNDLEDRLMCAYVIGWTVEKPKLWNVKVPHSTDGYYWRGISGQVHTYTEPDQHARVLKTEAYVWTQKQIDDADLQDCEKEEVTDDEEARDEC